MYVCMCVRFAGVDLWPEQNAEAGDAAARQTDELLLALCLGGVLLLLLCARVCVFHVYAFVRKRERKMCVCVCDRGRQKVCMEVYV